MSDLTYTFKWKTGAKEKIEAFPDNVLYDTANTFKRASMYVTPMRTGALRSSANRYGVKNIGNHTFRIANTMYYSSPTYQGYFLNESTGEVHPIHNWTTSGTGAYWYRNTWLRSGMTIFKGAVASNFLKIKR